MSDFFDRLADTAERALSAVDKEGRVASAIGGLKAQLEEADRRRKVRLLEHEIQELEAQVAQSTEALSAQVLALYDAGKLEQPELVRLCVRIGELRTQITAKKADLLEIQPPPPTAASRCAVCGSTVPAHAAFCATCGAQTSAKQVAPARFCAHCGAELRSTSQFCPTCGQPVES
jgi:NADH pyrophosphatase NudC (nudix superfamily)